MLFLVPLDPRTPMLFVVPLDPRTPMLFVVLLAGHTVVMLELVELPCADIPSREAYVVEHERAKIAMLEKKSSSHFQMCKAYNKL